MKTNLYVITDVKAMRTTEPFSCPNDSVAKRNFLFGCFASDTPPQDCLLWRVGEFSIDDSDCNSFMFTKTEFVAVTATIEEIEAYSKVYNSMHLDKNYEEFEDKGVVA